MKILVLTLSWLLAGLAATATFAEDRADPGAVASVAGPVYCALR